MATFKGNAGMAKVCATGGTEAAVGECTAWKLDTVGDVIEDTANGDAAQTFIAGLKTWTAEITAHYDPADTSQGVMVEGASVDLVLELVTGDTPDIAFSGTGIVTAVSAAGSIAPNVFSATFSVQGSGALTRNE